MCLYLYAMPTTKKASIKSHCITETKSKSGKVITFRITTVDDAFVATVKFKNLPTGKYANQCSRVISEEAACLAKIIAELN